MRILVTGITGQLGHDLINEVAKRGHECIGVNSKEMDVTDASACERVITEAGPDALIHCAAYTAVDAAEDNIDTWMKVNRDGTENIAAVCEKQIGRAHV